MNSKAIRKQLLAAVAMVLVAAVALGSSTYAWFVASGTVTAKGMNVQAQSDGGLVINYHGGAWGATATADPSDLRELSPASTRDLQTWFSATALGPDATKYKANLSEVEDISDEFAHETSKDEKDKATASTHGMLKYFEIRSATKQNVPKGLYVKEIKVTNPDGSVPDQYMSTSLRVGVECVYGSGTNDKTYTIYAPVSLGAGTNNNPTTTYPVIQAKTSGGGYEYGPEFTVTPIGSSSNPIVPGTVTIPVSGAIQVYIYVWFEGEDANLYSDNFYAEPLNVTVSFTSITNDGTVVIKPDLTSATAAGTATYTIDTTPYYLINGVTLNGQALYASNAGAVTSGTTVYTLTVSEGVASNPQNVTTQCTMPAAQSG